MEIKDVQEIGKVMLINEDVVKRHIISDKKNNPNAKQSGINYKALYQDFRDALLRGEIQHIIGEVGV